MPAKITIPYRNELIALGIILVTFFLVKNRLADTKVRINGINSDIERCDKEKSLARSWQNVSKEFDESLKGVLFADSFSIKKLFQDKAWSNDIDIQSLQLNKNISGIVAEAGINAKVTGKFKDIINFIAAAEESQLRVRSISITGKDEKKTVNINMYSYFNKENE